MSQFELDEDSLRSTLKAVQIAKYHVGNRIRRSVVANDDLRIEYQGLIDAEVAMSEALDDIVLGDA